MIRDVEVGFLRRRVFPPSSCAKCSWHLFACTALSLFHRFFLQTMCATSPKSSPQNHEATRWWVKSREYHQSWKIARPNPNQENRLKTGDLNKWNSSIWWHYLRPPRRLHTSLRQTKPIDRWGGIPLSTYSIRTSCKLVWSLSETQSRSSEENFRKKSKKRNSLCLGRRSSGNSTAKHRSLFRCGRTCGSRRIKRNVYRPPESGI